MLWNAHRCANRAALGPYVRAAIGPLIAISIAAASVAQVADPVPGPIPIGTASARVEFVTQLPSSGPGGNPNARPMILIGDGTGRTFVVDQNGLILQLFANGSTSLFLDLSASTPLLANQGQQGLSSFAFHPDYHSVGADGFGKIYTASSEPLGSGTLDFPFPVGSPQSHHSVIYEWTVSANPDAIDTSSARELLRVGEPYGDHNVGQIAFDPGLASGHVDYGLLYIAMGDGGNVCCPRPSVDPWFQGQDLSTPLAAMLRIDPLEPQGGGDYSVPSNNPFLNDGDPNTLGEIWVYGLRNPHRFSWDRGGDGRMLISDIGQANVEEINLGAIGANYGWSEREGTYLVMHFNEDDVFPLPGGDAALGYTYPVIQYDHDENDRAISGGYVQRGLGLGTVLEGHYIFGDLPTGRVFHVPVSTLDGSGQAAFEVLRLIDDADGVEKSLLEMIGGSTPAPRADLRFGLDDAGDIYLLTKRDGSVRRFVTTPRAIPVMGRGAQFALAAGLALLAGVALGWHRSGEVRKHRTPAAGTSTASKIRPEVDS